MSKFLEIPAFLLLNYDSKIFVIGLIMFTWLLSIPGEQIRNPPVVEDYTIISLEGCRVYDRIDDNHYRVECGDAVESN